MKTSNHELYMEVALEMAKRALEAGDFPVGCVLVYKDSVVATGKREKSCNDSNELDHAEILALRRLSKVSPDIPLGEVTVYSTMEPCLMCFSTLVVNGVRRVVYGYEDAMGGGTGLELARLAPLYRDIQMEIIPDILRNKSLALFKEFFAKESSGYLQGSLLASYTLNAKATES